MPSSVFLRAFRGRLGPPLGCVLVAALLACSRPARDQKWGATAAGATSSEGAAQATPAPAAQRRRLVVFAASSLTDAFNDLERSFEAKNADVDVALSYGGSQLLKLQISEGAPSDVFASADEAHMQELVAAGRAAASQTLAWNELVLVVPRDNPANIRELSELTRAERLVIGAANVPVGAYTRALLSRAAQQYGAAFEREVLAHVVSEESNVRLVRAKVELGEADAAIVYRTDAAGSKDLRQLPIPPELNVRASYPIAALSQAPEPALARRWIAYVLSAEGQSALGTRGFLLSETRLGQLPSPTRQSPSDPLPVDR
jgi:molybdate transport system substrate-binding protein